MKLLRLQRPKKILKFTLEIMTLMIINEIRIKELFFVLKTLKLWQQKKVLAM